jgi:hypothetical protein
MLVRSTVPQAALTETKGDKEITFLDSIKGRWSRFDDPRTTDPTAIATEKPG